MNFHLSALERQKASLTQRTQYAVYVNASKTQGCT
ncbi:hypothetical protein SPHINGOT1_460019 [Sphingomonas sp. T1]|nr:hypothetical protein SPHINGOT1_460019 [Sphingomonas sp. T1]